MWLDGAAIFFFFLSCQCPLQCASVWRGSLLQNSALTLSLLAARGWMMLPLDDPIRIGALPLYL